MNRYSRVLAPAFWMSWPAAAADPPVAIRSLLSAVASVALLLLRHQSRVVTLEVEAAHSLENDDRLSGLDRILLHLKLVHSVLLLVLGDVAGSGQLSGLADGHKGRANTKCDDRAEEESTGVKADDDVWRRARELGEDVVNKVGDELLEGGGGAEEGEDVEEGDSLWVSEATGYDQSMRRTFLGKSGCTPRRDLRWATSDMMGMGVVIGRVLDENVVRSFGVEIC